MRRLFFLYGQMSAVYSRAPFIRINNVKRIHRDRSKEIVLKAILIRLPSENLIMFHVNPLVIRILNILLSHYQMIFIRTAIVIEKSAMDFNL
uniref:Uncharacterized protein n=1 Tax=Romanomermis culicivorax TaxID=13658 RepID=A0A915JWV9_ROMCU